MKIVSLVTLSADDRTEIKALGDDIQLVDAAGWFDGEFAQTWPSATVQRYVASAGQGTRSERDALLADAEIVVCGFPFPLDLYARAPQLKWMHQRPAGASNLLNGDIWGRDVLVTTSRGHGEVLAIAEYAISGLCYFAKGFDQAQLDLDQGAFDATKYAISSLHDKTLCVIGAGGIGRAVGRLGHALGMQVTGTRRNITRTDEDAAFTTIATPDQLYDLLGQADFVAVCCHWTPATENLLSDEAFAAMRPGAVITNVARGEIIDEPALLRALDANRVRGAALDVYVGEFEGPPASALWLHPRVLITPHTSNKTDISQRRDMQLFLQNLQCYRSNEPLAFKISWADGY